MEKKMEILTFAAVALLFAVCFIGFVAINDGEVDAEGTTTNVAKIGETPYPTLVDAIKNVKDEETITLVRDVTDGSGVGIFVNGDGYTVYNATTFAKEEMALKKGEKLTLDLNGKMYRVTTPAVGSDGYKTQAFHLEKDFNVTIKSGTITSSGSSVKMLVQNYCNLTLDNVTLDGSNLPGSETNVLSNNYGDVIINDSTIKAKEGGVAFDVCGFSSYGNHNVTVNGSTIIQGGIELTGNNNDRTMNLIINDIKLEGKISDLNPGKVIVKINGGSFSDLSGLAYVVEGKTYNLVSDCTIDSNITVKAKTTLNIVEGVSLTNNGQIDNKGTIVNNGTIIVKDATGLKTAVAAGGKISLAKDIKITEHDTTDDKNGLKITKSVEIDGNDKKISFIGGGTIYGLVFSEGCGGSKLSNVSLDFGGIAKYGLCVRDMTSTTTGGVTFEKVTVDNYKKTGIDLNSINGKISFKNVDVRGNGHYVDAATNLTRGHGYALVIDDLKNNTNNTEGEVITDNCTITSVNVHNFCGAIPVGSVDLSGCKELLFVSVEDGSKNDLTSVYDEGVDHKKQTGKDTIINTEGPSKGLLIGGTILFPAGFDTSKHAIFNTVTNADNGDKGDNHGSFEILRAYRVCYGMAFFDASVNIVDNYTINCDVMIPKDIVVTIGKGAILTISDGVKLYNCGVITNNGTILLSSLDVLKDSKINSGNVILNGNITIDNDYVIPNNVKFFIGDKANVVVASGVTLNVAGTVGTNGTVTLAKGAGLTIAENSTFTGTINGPDNNKLVANGMKAGIGGITITGGSLIINGKIMDAGGSEAGATVTVTGNAIKIEGMLESDATMVIEEGTVVTVENGKTFLSNGTVNNNGIIDNKGIITNNGVMTNDGTIKMTGASEITSTDNKKVVNNGIVVDERAENKAAVPVTNDGTVVAKNNADEYKKAKIDVVEQDPDKPVATEGKIEVNTNKYAFITHITTTGKLNIVLNDGYKQYTVTIPEGTTIAAGTVISVSFIEYQSDSVTRYQINTPGIENFSMKLPCQIGFKKAKVYCDDSEMGVSKVRYDAGTGYVTFDASHNSVFTIVLSNASPAGTTTVSGGDASNDYSLVIAFVVLVASLGFLAYVIKRR